MVHAVPQRGKRTKMAFTSFLLKGGTGTLSNVSTWKADVMRATIAGFSGVLLVGIGAFQPGPQTFVIRSDIDTVAVEHLARTANTLTGDLHLSEEGTNVHYVLHLRSDGSAATAEVANEAPNFFTGMILFGDPSTNVGQAGVAGRVVRAPPDFLPVIGTSMGLIDYVIRLRNPAIGDSVVIKVLNIRNRIPGRMTLKRFAPDSILVDCNGCMRRGMTEELRVGLSVDGGIDGAVGNEGSWTISHR
jgi:hypothetical protein